MVIQVKTMFIYSPFTFDLEIQFSLLMNNFLIHFLAENPFGFLEILSFFNGAQSYNNGCLNPSISLFIYLIPLMVELKNKIGI